MKRIRVANCPYCDKLTALDRKERNEHVVTTVCINCLTVFVNNSVNSKLIDLNEYWETVRT